MPVAMNNQQQQPVQENNSMIDIYENNLLEAFELMTNVVRTHPYIAMDTEFPGVVARPIGEFPTQQAFQYQQVRVNCNLLKLIQLGLTFYDENGLKPATGPATFQFNFKFDKSSDMYAQDSMTLLEKSAINFAALEQGGISHDLFAELLMTSGIVLLDECTILSFHSSYDFGYLLKLLQGYPLPDNESEFMSNLQIFFPKIYDIKFLMKSCKSLNGGLEDISKALDIQRVGQQHQAGSDSHLTGQCFFALREQYFEGVLDPARHGGRLFGVNEHYGKQASPVAAEGSERYQSNPLANPDTEHDDRA